MEIGRCLLWTVLVLAIGCSSLPAQALCSYKGRQNAITTLREEFADSQLVVRARVLAIDDHWSDEGDSWTVYRLGIRRVYKGSPARKLKFFTFRNSGGFYLETGSRRRAGADYLLFLNANRQATGEPAAIVGTVSVNYPCGMSKEWKDVTVAEKQELLRLGGREITGGGAVRR